MPENHRGEETCPRSHARFRQSSQDGVASRAAEARGAAVLRGGAQSSEAVRRLTGRGAVAASAWLWGHWPGQCLLQLLPQPKQNQGIHCRVTGLPVSAEESQRAGPMAACHLPRARPGPRGLSLRPAGTQVHPGVWAGGSRCWVIYVPLGCQGALRTQSPSS